MSNSGIFNSIPQSVVSAAAVKQILDFIDSCVLCRGQDDERFIAYIYTKKGKIMDPSGIWNDVFFLYMYVSSMFCILFNKLSTLFYQVLNALLSWMQSIPQYAVAIVNSSYTLSVQRPTRYHAVAGASNTAAT